jgi:hypothetical protein
MFPMDDKLHHHNWLTLDKAVQVIPIWWQVQVRPIIYLILSYKRDNVNLEYRAALLRILQRKYPVRLLKLKGPKIGHQIIEITINQRYYRFCSIPKTTAKKSKWWLWPKEDPSKTITIFPIKSRVPRLSKYKTWTTTLSVWYARRSTISKIRVRMWWTDAGIRTAESA